MENSRFKFRVWNNMQKCYSQDDHYIDEDGQLNTIGKYIVEQCTGLKDKNGKLIYEGDIIDTQAGVYVVDVDDFGLWVVVYKGNPFKEVREWSDLVKSYYFDNPKTFEIIGNIHKNADLLENEE